MAVETLLGHRVGVDWQGREIGVTLVLSGFAGQDTTIRIFKAGTQVLEVDKEEAAKLIEVLQYMMELF